ncbi:MAG: hypothetical protein QOE55_2796 [Acidobacteriaceae bacterium]|jgi:hypothetical protein|nr:hypothetical protein [Acidobacteriaceae bacterium]
MTQSEIDARRHALAAEHLALESCPSERGLEIAHAFGVPAEQEDYLQQRRRRYGKSAAGNRLMASPQPGAAARHEDK